MLRKFMRDAAVYTIPALVSRGIAFFLVPLYTRVLAPSEYGSLDLLTVFGSIVNLVVALEVSQGVARYWAKESEPVARRLYSSTAFWFSAVCYAAFVACAWLLTPQVAELVMAQPGLETEFRIGTAYIGLNGMFYLVQNQLRWEMRSVAFAAVSTLSAFVTATASVALAYVLRFGLSGVVLGMVAGAACGLALGVWFIRLGIRLEFSWPRLREMLSFSTPLVLSGVAVWVNMYADRILINKFLSVAEVGLFGVGFRLASVCGLVVVGFQSALTPLVYAHHREPDTPRKLADLFRWYVALCLLMCLLLAVFAVDILSAFAAPEYFGSATVVFLLAPAICLSTMYMFAPGIGLAMRTELVAAISVIGGLVNLLTGFFLVPRLGIVGAGAATLLSYVFQVLAYVIVGQRFYRVPYDWTTIFGGAIAIFGSGALFIRFRPAGHLSVVFPLLVAVIAIALIVMVGLVRWTEARASVVALRTVLSRAARAST